MILNKQIFQREPTKYKLPNDGVAKVTFPTGDKEWEVAALELENFVCEGSYQEGLQRILETYLANLTQPTQRAVWVHGFYGCGKSQLVRILDFIWRDLRFPDGSTARSKVNLPLEIQDALIELTNAGRQQGGLWSAAGALSAGSHTDPRTAILGIVFRSAGLPETVNLAQFELWIRQEGWLTAIQEGLANRGRDYQRELKNIFVSTSLAEELLKVNNQLGSTPAEVLGKLQEQFPSEPTVTTELMVDLMHQVFMLNSNQTDKLPLVLIVIDELQQYMGDDNAKADIVQEIIQAAVSRFDSNLLFVATGQSSLETTPILQKLQHRFTVHVALEDKDTETVLQQTVLRKKQSEEANLEKLLENMRGEIDRHLGGTKLEPRSNDNLTANYPLLPTRLRFWQQLLRDLDHSGTSGQLRSQLRLAHESARTVANDPLGHVVGGDFIFEQQRPILLQTNVLLRDIDGVIQTQKDGSEDGELKSRICALLFLIKETDSNLGLKANADTLADLLVTDLASGSTSLRQRIPQLLEELVENGTVMQLDEEYQLQTREGAEWEKDYRTRLASIKGDNARLSNRRLLFLQEAVESILHHQKYNQGESKTPRNIDFSYGQDPPIVERKIPIWVRSGWDITEATVRKEAQEAGKASPIVFAFLPRINAEILKQHIAGFLAAGDVLSTRPHPTTEEGKAAHRSVEARLRSHEKNIQRIVDEIIANTKIYLGGGTESPGSDLKEMVSDSIWTAAHRLYPHFQEADSSAWSRVASRAKNNDPSSLNALGYDGDSDQHPVCKEILKFIGHSGKTGNEIRRHFEDPPFGWPQDAIDASLLVLTAAGHLQAKAGSRHLTVSELSASTINQTAFRAEERIISTVERIKIRKFLSDLSVNYKHGEEASASSEALSRILRVAQAAGGEPPLPERPSTKYVEDMKQLQGNELLAAIFKNHKQLLSDYEKWNEARKKAQERMPNWALFEKLLEHAVDLPVYKEVRVEFEAIKNQRRLLVDPNPLPPLINQLSNALRDAINNARDEHLAAYNEKISNLLNNENWKQLSSDEQNEIRTRTDLLPLPKLNVKTEEALLQELTKNPLSTWKVKTAAMAERITQALLLATKATTPAVERLSLPSSTIKSQEELDVYLNEIREKALAIIKSGKQVILP
jgi:hypothetical protein